MIPLLALVAACTCQAPPPEAAGPDVLLITVDTLRADRLGFAGHAEARTPHLDALAARGRVYPEATTPLPRTTPALASALTGLVPAHHGSVEVGDPIDAVPTLASRLHDAGFATLGLSAMQVAGPEQGLDAGFDTFEVHHDAPAGDLVDRALALTEATPGRRFLWVHFADPHFPYLPPGEDAEPCRAEGRRAASGDLQRVELFVDQGGRATQLLASCSRLYDGEIAAVDTAIGRLLEGLGGDPWVVFSADHGEHLGEDGLFFEHGPTVHDANLRVPLVVAGPGVEAGNDPRLAQLVDILPTLTGLAGAQAGSHDGLDLLDAPTRAVATARSGSALQARLSTSLVAGRERRWCLHAPRYSRCEGRKGATLHDREHDPELRVDVRDEHPDLAAQLDAAAARWGPEQAREHTVFDAGHKLVMRPRLDGGHQAFLYDRTADPLGAHDLAAEQPDVVQRLAEAAPATDVALPAAAPRDEATLEQLRSLGYVE